MNLYLRLGIALLLFAAAHACKGVSDTLQFHYDESRYAQLDNQEFWNPELSWKYKWELDANRELVRPKREKFLGSSTVFVATTDAWHLLQSVQFALTRLAVVMLIVPWLNIVVLRRWRWPVYAGCYAVIWIVQALGFHLTYTLLQ